jgi:hypothetical protein
MSSLAGLLARSLHELLDGVRTEQEVAHSLRAALSHVSPQLTLVPDAKPAAVPEGDREVALRLFEYWRSRCDHPRARADATRLGKAIARLRDGFSEAELRAAIDGMAGSDFNRGVNENGTRYDDIELCFRNVRNVERFIEKAGGPRHADATRDGRADLRAQAQKALKDGRTDEYNRILRKLKGEQR